MISPAFAAALAAGRGAFNQRVRDARRRYPALRTDVLHRFLAEEVDGVVAAVDPARAGAVATAALDIALELVGRSLVGNSLVGSAARTGTPAAVWRTLLPRCAHLVAAHPDTVPAMLTNAAIHLDAVPGVRGAEWIALLAALAPRVATVDELGRAGQVAAWRAGAAHFRAGAIAAADALPEALALATFGADAGGSWPALRARIVGDPWWTADGADVSAGREVGGFTGFGGAFGAPPEVRAGADGFVVRAGERCHLLLADAYGAVLLGARPEEFDAAAPGACDFVVAADALTVGARRIAFDLPADGLAVCASGATLAIASPYTHAIRVLPREPR
jgi:hypothetical protein